MDGTHRRGGARLEPPVGFIERLRSARRPVLLTHVYPDGDAIGSELALYRAFRELGAEPRIVNAHPSPLLQEFLDPEGVVEVTRELADSGQALRLCQTNETVREVFEITEIASMFDHYDDVNSAVRSFL